MHGSASLRGAMTARRRRREGSVNRANRFGQVWQGAHCGQTFETAVNRSCLAAVLALLLLGLPAVRAHAQWVPTGSLAAVPVIRDCNETGGDVAVSRLDPPTVYLCPTVVRLIRKTHPGAEHFYFVHEFGHLAQGTSDEAAADCWAAKELVKAPNGSRYLMAAIEHFRQRPTEYSARYGTPQGRAERIRSCAEEERPSFAADVVESMAPKRTQTSRKPGAGAAPS
jgi:hypothetical protein